MATITGRKRGDGRMAWTAQIRIKAAGQLVHSEAKTFSRRAAAKAWADEREAQVRADPGAAANRAHEDVTVGRLIERYVAHREAAEPLGRSKGQHLALLRTFAISELKALELSPAQVVAHVRWRRSRGTGGSTVANDLIWLRVVFRYARVGLGIPVDSRALDEAAELCWQERLIARPKRRTRRPTDDELKRISERFRELRMRGRRNPGPPMDLILWAAIYGCRRLGELCSLRISDLDRERGLWLVRDIKHPEGSRGRHREMLVTDRMLAVVDQALVEIARPVGDDRLFPYLSRSIGTAWTRQMRMLGIEDLHFHDLRHEGCSRLADDGLTIPQIQRVSLHESWGSLQIYVNQRARPGERVEFLHSNS